MDVAALGHGNSQRTVHPLTPYSSLANHSGTSTTVPLPQAAAPGNGMCRSYGTRLAHGLVWAFRQDLVLLSRSDLFSSLVHTKFPLFYGFFDSWPFQAYSIARSFHQYPFQNLSSFCSLIFVIHFLV